MLLILYRQSTSTLELYVRSTDAGEEGWKKKKNQKLEILDSGRMGGGESRKVWSLQHHRLPALTPSETHGEERADFSIRHGLEGCDIYGNEQLFVAKAHKHISISSPFKAAEQSSAIIKWLATFQGKSQFFQFIVVSAVAWHHQKIYIFFKKIPNCLKAKDHKQGAH